MSTNIRKYCLSVTVYIKPEKREAFLHALAQNQQGTLMNEKLVLLYAWGENTKEPNTFHIQEQYIGAEGLADHHAQPHFIAWQKFLKEAEPFAKPPVRELFQEPDFEYSTTISGAKLAENEPKKFGLNVTVKVKPERREEFLRTLTINHQGTLTNEPLVRVYTWGESIDTPNTFHVQEQYLGEEGFLAHAGSDHFIPFKEFSSGNPDSPYTEPPTFSFFQEY
jgi:quinol monooxygenase YgiN